MTTPPPGAEPYGQWGGYPQQGPHGTQYASQPGYGGGYPDHGQYGQGGGYPPPYQPQGAYQPPPGGYPGQPGYPGQGGYPPYQPPPSGPNRTGMVVGIVVVVVALIAGGGAGWYFLFGPGAPKNDTGTVAAGSTTPSTIPGAGGLPGTIPTVPPGPPEDPDNDGIPGVDADADGGGDFDLDVEIGDCIRLGGTVDDATAEAAQCGTFDANYKVVAKAPTSEECPADIDQSVFQSQDDIQVGALCLDIDFVQGDCFELSGEDPLRVDCDAPPGLDTVRVANTIRGNGDVGACPDDNGVPYPDRGFVVCLESL
jgi:hypothetical protein